MANGQVVLITTEQLGERPVTRTVYYVAEEDPVKATGAVADVVEIRMTLPPEFSGYRVMRQRQAVVDPS